MFSLGDLVNLFVLVVGGFAYIVKNERRMTSLETCLEKHIEHSEKRLDNHLELLKAAVGGG